MSLPDLTKTLRAQAEEKFGQERASQLHGEIETMAAELWSLHDSNLDVEDEP